MTRIPAIALSVVLLCGGSAFAQGMQAGVRGGVNFASLQSDDDEGVLDPQIRGVVGGFVTLPVMSWLEVQPEVLYSMKGAKSNEFGIESKLLLDYIEVPVLARITKRAFGTRSFYVAGGPSFGLRVRAKARAEFSGSTEEIDISDDVERFDLGAVIAGGLEFGSIVVDGRYTLGLSDIDTDTSDEVKVKNRAVSLTVGFKF
jgi:hypothetical protein